MANLDLVLQQVKYYSSNYRHPKLDSFEISEPYDLFPENKLNPNSWPNTYPNADKACVYIFTDSNMEVMYIGKAVNLGYRLGNYFMFDENRDCKLKHSWIGEIRFLITIAVPDTSKFECATLEAFLLENDEIFPINNTKKH